MTIQTYPMNFANLDVPQPPRDSVLVNLTDVEDEMRELRIYLWLNHGHQGVYGDDGEMQCSRCAQGYWDWKRLPLEQLIRKNILEPLAAANRKLAEMVDLEDAQRLLEAYREQHRHLLRKFRKTIGACEKYVHKDMRCPTCKEYDALKEKIDVR